VSLFHQNLDTTNFGKKAILGLCTRSGTTNELIQVVESLKLQVRNYPRSKYLQVIVKNSTFCDGKIHTMIRICIRIRMDPHWLGSLDSGYGSETALRLKLESDPDPQINQ
jgi:hypothetical protein